MANDTRVCVCGETDCDIPYGFCHCSCGESVGFWEQNHTRLGGVKGQPHKYVRWHQSRKRPKIEDATPFKIDGEYCRLIPLSLGMHMIVWESDYLWLMQWNWSATYMKMTDAHYATRKHNGRRDGKTL